MSDGKRNPEAHWYPPGRGAPTPWGRADVRYDYAPGVRFYSTPGHGGFRVTNQAAQSIPAPFRRADGWYEEDVDAAIVGVFLLGEEKQAATLRDYYPDEWTAATGEPLTEDQSRELAERGFRERHADDWVSVAAWGHWDDWVPAGMVGVCARKGRYREQCYGDPPREERYFLVPEAEYKGRSRHGFVIDVARHEEIPETVSGA